MLVTSEHSEHALELEFVRQIRTQ